MSDTTKDGGPAFPRRSARRHAGHAEGGMMNNDKYHVAVALAGVEVTKAADAHIRALRGLMLSGKLHLTADYATCEMIAAGIERLERAISVHKKVTAGKIA